MAAVAGALLANVWFDVAAVRSVRAFSTDRMMTQFAEWLRAQPVGTVALTPHLRASLAERGVTVPPAPEGARDLAFFAFDGPVSGLHANRRGPFVENFGPHSVNMDYYPDWVGEDRILVLSGDR
jgi:hypothetical protein